MRKVIVVFFIFTVYNIGLFGQDKKVQLWDESSLLRRFRPQVESRFPEGFEYKHLVVYDIKRQRERGREALVSSDGDFTILYAVNYFPAKSGDSLFVSVLTQQGIPRSMNDYFWNKVEEDLKYTMGDRYISLQKSPITYYSRNESLRKFNADRAISYPLVASEEKPLALKTDYCRVFILHKNERGWISMYCYYNKMPRKKLKGYIQKVEGIFRYLDPEEFIEYSDEDEIPLILNKK